MSSIKYSIIVPVFNNQSGVDQIIEALHSIEGFGEKAELIIVDDGSTIPIAVNESDWVRLIRQPNTGVSGARNHGIKAAKGTYVSFLDSDDSYDTKVLNVWDEVTKQSTDASVFVFEYRICDRINNKIFYQTHKCGSGLYSGSDALKYYFEKQIFSHICSIVINRKFLIKNAILFNQNLALSEDVLFAIECIYYAPRVHVERRSYFSYVIHKGSVTNVVATEKVLNHFEAFKVINNVGVPYDIIPYRNYFIATMYLNFLLKLISNKTSSEKVIVKTIRNRNFLQESLKSKFSIRYAVTLGFKLVSYLPSSFLKLLLSKVCLRRHEY
ncbi:glycosyltransferase [Alteromonas sp. 345S023]|uniref:Glycosyltransferase n=1 Tax=Alteromonas profundi TaxID=2696062 RepID=A0A7X5RJS0_9ALTE|nr:glycosyltransferase [Alteromonas profundi]NDV89956.1 glycosyltransferase [Alteromonas profundi]